MGTESHVNLSAIKWAWFHMFILIQGRDIHNLVAGVTLITQKNYVKINNKGLF